MTAMRALALLVVLAAPAAAVVGCASAPSEPDWVGKKVSAAIERYGPPTRVTPTALGTTYMWETRRPRAPGTGAQAAQPVRVTVRMMTVDAAGFITSFTRVDE